MSALDTHGERTDNFGDCAACGVVLPPDAPDPCLGRLPGVRSGCCGHGDPLAAYLVFDDGTAIRHFDVVQRSGTS
jgi:hypothetical protein